MQHSLKMIVVANSDKHTCLGTRKPIGRDIGVFKGLPGNLQQKALLWVHGQDLAWRNSEKGRIKSGNVGEKSASPNGHSRRHIRIRIEISVDIPPIAWYLADRIAPLSEQFPKTLNVVGTGKSTGKAHHGDPFMGTLLHRLDLIVEFERQQR